MSGYDRRIRIEQSIMKKELPQFALYETCGEFYFQGWHRTTYKSDDYKLKLVLPPGFPDERPKLYIVDPILLIGKKGDEVVLINSQGTSHKFHTLSNGPDRCIQICHYDAATWNSSISCVAVLFKALLWLEAYELHKNHNMTIDEIIKNIRRSQERNDRILSLEKILLHQDQSNINGLIINRIKRGY